TSSVRGSGPSAWTASSRRATASRIACSNAGCSVRDRKWSRFVSDNILMILTFGAVVAAVAGVYSLLADLYLRDRARVSQRIDDEFRQRQRDRVRKSLLFKDLKEAAFDAVKSDEAAPTLRQRLDVMIEQSGLDLTAQKLLIVTLISGLGAGLA